MTAFQTSEILLLIEVHIPLKKSAIGVKIAVASETMIFHAACKIDVMNNQTPWIIEAIVINISWKT